MAEVVEKRMELMIEQELKEMLRTNLYKKSEVRLIQKKRREFERKIASVTKMLQDFVDYIVHEKLLLRQVRERRNKFKIGEQKSDIDYKIIRRIKDLYEKALQRFSDNFPLHLEYFRFCQESNYGNAASVAINNMMKICAHKVEVWVEAGTWFAKQGDVDKALHTFHKGLAHHKTSKVLYLGAIKLELRALDNVAEGEMARKQEICYKKIETYVESYCENLNNFSDLNSLLRFLQKHEFTMPIQNRLIKVLLAHHSDNYLLWHTLAQREKQGMHYDASSDGTRNDRIKTTKTCLINCFATYKQGLTQVSHSAGKADLWSLYLDCLIELQHVNTNVANVTKLDALRTALEEASAENYLTEHYYIKWLELVSDAQALSVLEKGTENLPDSVELWKLRLRYTTMIEDSVTRVRNVFDLGVIALRENALPLWFMWLRYLTLYGKQQEIEAVYQAGISRNESSKVSDALKPRYIEWLGLQKGNKQARAEYDRLAMQQPYCKELHSVMLSMESTELKVDMESMISIHDLACKQFGHEDVDVWINHAFFYMRYTKDYGKKVEKVCEDAKKNLPSYLLCEFYERFRTLAHENARSIPNIGEFNF